MNYQETIEYLYNQLPMFQRVGKEAYKANLKNTIELDHLTNHPHRLFDTIHIAGTNGKGTTSHILASLFQTAGFKTGLYTSPHLKSFRERIRIDGIEIPEDFVVQFVKKYKASFEQIKPSFFEMTVALAFEYFAHEKVDIAIIETGMGGRLDSTNIISPKLSIITNISLDHTQFLGDSLEKIALEKAGIIKPGIPILIGESCPETDFVFQEKADLENAQIYFADKEFDITPLSLKSEYNECIISGDYYTDLMLETDLQGGYQSKNIRTSFAAFNLLKHIYPIKLKHFQSGLKSVKKNTGLMGRWQYLGDSPTILCDTGHNEAGIKEVVKGLSALSFKKLHFILGVVNDKDITGILKLLPKNAQYYFTNASIPRALKAEHLKNSSIDFDLNGDAYPSVQEALNAAKRNASGDDLIFIGGSTFIVAELL